MLRLLVQPHVVHAIKHMLNIKSTDVMVQNKNMLATNHDRIDIVIDEHVPI